jgi:ADP-ribose pyrophosphatase YjhB (NUDIX family)
VAHTTECVVTEVREEASLEVKVIKLAAVYERSRHPHAPLYSFHIYKIFFICEIVMVVPSPGIETDGVHFFEADKLPELSVSGVLAYQIARMFAHASAPHLPTECD